MGDSDVVLLDVFVWSMPRNMAYPQVQVVTVFEKHKNKLMAKTEKSKKKIVFTLIFKNTHNPPVISVMLAHTHSYSHLFDVDYL